MLSTNLWFGNSEMVGNTVLVASAEPDVGRSTTAANLAITLAKDGAKVILVDGDLRQPAQQDVFGLDNEIGLSNILVGKLALKDALKPTSVTDLLVLTSGPLPANPMRLFRSPQMQKFVDEISRLADYVVFDSPAGISFADGTLLAGLVKNVVIVYAAGTVPRGAEIEFIKKLELVNANILGTVLNMVNPEDSHGFYHMRVGYEEILRSSKGSAAVAERMLKAIPDDTGEEADEKSDRE
jgi:capsular exopolysaccharide synthesis family protein